jgi:hypothetical protein
LVATIERSFVPLNHGQFRFKIQSTECPRYPKSTATSLWCRRLACKIEDVAPSSRIWSPQLSGVLYRSIVGIIVLKKFNQQKARDIRKARLSRLPVCGAGVSPAKLKTSRPRPAFGRRN